MIRVLPPNLCALLDVRYHHRRGESEAIIGLMRQKSYLCQGLVGAALKDVFSLYVEGIETEACPISDPCMAAHIRQLVLGPTLALPIRRDASLQLERFEDLKDQTSVQVDAGIRDFVDTEGRDFKVGKHECVKLMKHGLLLHPNSDQQFVHVRRDNVTGGQGVLTHLVASLSNEDSEDVLVYAAPTLRQLPKRQVARLKGGTQQESIPLPKPEHRQWSDGLYVGVKMSPGKRPDGARLMLNRLVVSRGQR